MNKYEQKIAAKKKKFEELASNAFSFKEKPSLKIREVLKINGFRWTPSKGSWTRKINNNSL